MSEILKKYRSVFLYLIFGLLTVLINTTTYVLLYKYLFISNIISNIIAWILAVVFAFITNKIWVFSSKSTKINVFVYEMISFFGCRFMTGLIDLGVMFIMIDVLGMNAVVIKILSNVVVIILNYIASKLVIFKKKNQKI